MRTDNTPQDGDLGAVRSSPHAARRRFLILVLVGSPALAVVVIVSLGIVDSLRAAREVRAGRAAFVELADSGLGRTGHLREMAERGALRFAAGARISRRSVWLRTWARIPFGGRPARWLRSATAATATLAGDAAAAVGRIEPMLDFGDPSARLDLLASIEREFARLSEAVSRVRLPATGGFLPPVNAADRELRADLRRVRVALRRGTASAAGVRSLLAGPSTYAVLAANNAEMRAGGMVLQVGILNADGGRVTTGGFRSTAELALKDPVPVPAEINALYGWLDPDTEWRNVGSSPNFPAVAPIYAAMAERNGLGKVDGVFQIDVPGLRGLLDVVGPVEVNGRRYDDRNVERLVLHRLYVTFGSDQLERRHEFSELASEVFRALNVRRWRLDRLAAALRTAAAGRHLLAWSSRPADQAAWEALGMDGALQRDGFMVTVQNHAGNKLDWYVRPAVELRVERRPGRWRRVHADIRITNPTPDGQSAAVAGDGTIVPRGDYRGFVAMYLPGWATNVEMKGRGIISVGPDGPMRVLGALVDIPRAATVTVEVSFSVPPGVDHVVLLPSARVRPVPVKAAGLSLDDAERRVVPI